MGILKLTVQVILKTDMAVITIDIAADLHVSFHLARVQQSLEHELLGSLTAQDYQTLHPRQLRGRLGQGERLLG